MSGTAVYAEFILSAKTDDDSPVMGFKPFDTVGEIV